jgi:hypothetical protein
LLVDAVEVGIDFGGAFGGVADRGGLVEGDVLE